jgi:hypothetical protein
VKLGALPPQRPYGLSTLSVYANGKIPAPPAKCNPPYITNWGMLDNDVLGCCTISGAAHAVMAWDSEVAQHDPPPNDDSVASTYLTMTHGADTGLVEANVLQTWQAEGLFGRQIAAYAPVETHDLTGFHQAVAFYGAAYLGVALPKSAKQQFASGKEWTVVPRSPIEGGHCILAVGYDQHSVQCVTWGQIVNVSYPWLARYLTETWAIIPNQFVEAGHGPSLDLDTLRKDLNRL